MMFKKTKSCAALVLAFSTLSAVPAPAFATLVTRHFEFSSTSGPIQFGPTIGSFTYDDSIVPVGGGGLQQTGLFVGLNISYGGHTYDETTANTGFMAFDALGNILAVHFGNHCYAGGCSIAYGQDDWWIYVGPQGLQQFRYSTVGERTEYITTARLLPPGAIPEPASLALLGIGLAGLGFTRKRKQA